MGLGVQHPDGLVVFSPGPQGSPARDWRDTRMSRTYRLADSPCSVLLVLIEVYRISQVRVPFEKIYFLNLVRMRTGITQDEQSIADVNDVDQSIPDDRIAPHDDLCLEVGIGGIRVQVLTHCRGRTCAAPGGCQRGSRPQR